MTRVFVCKQVVILFGVLLVLTCFSVIFSYLLFVDIGALRVDKQNLCDCDQKCYSKLLPEQMHVCLRWPFCCLREHKDGHFVVYENTVGLKGLENDRERSWSRRERLRALLESTRAVEGALGVDESG